MQSQERAKAIKMEEEGVGRVTGSFGELGALQAGGRA